MENERSRYEDFSEKDSLNDDFEPGGVKDILLYLHGSQIQKHLAKQNPIIGIQGLIGYLICANVAHSGRLEKRLGWLILLLATNTALLAFFAYKTVM